MGLCALSVSRFSSRVTRLQLTRRQQLRLDYCNLDLLAADADELIEGEEHNGAENEVVGERRLDEPPSPVEDHQNEEDGVGVVRIPETFVGVTTGELDSEDVDDEHVDRQSYTRQAWKKGSD